jgi:hypothetical protein
MAVNHQTVFFLVPIEIGLEPAGQRCQQEPVRRDIAETPANPEHQSLPCPDVVHTR